VTQLSTRVLTRTLWVRQQLVPAHRTVLDTTATVRHLIGLQAQDNLPPYLSLAARLDDFTPADLSDLIGTRELVRFRTMRGTVHVLTPDDALTLRPWVQPALDRASAANAQNRPAAHLAGDELEAAVRDILAGGSLPVGQLADRLAGLFSGVPEAVLRHVTPERVPLLQTPPRGQWRRSGGVDYALADDWLGRPFTEVDLPGLVGRYLRAYGPATAADMTKWSMVTRLAPVFKGLRETGELVTHTDPSGRTLYDVPDGVLADEDLDLPPLLLGTYDNVFLSHADRERIAPEPARKAWMGANGGVGATLFLDGLLAGLWRVDGGRIVVEPLRRLTRSERRAVDREKERVMALLAWRSRPDGHD
jgi:hypothetical protein